ncbi:MAG: RluA family pseudouridine synthase [Eubacteriales bacterium]
MKFDKFKYIGEKEIRLDKFISNQYKSYSRSNIQKLIEENNVKVNDLDQKKKYILKNGDEVKIFFPEPKKLQIKAENIDIDIVFEDEYLAVVNKQRGLVVHPAPGNREGTLVNGLLNELDNLSSINGIIRPGIVHRIDKDTTGLLLIAKNNLAHLELSKEIKKHKTKREYTALVHGVIPNNKGKIILPIGRDPKNRKKMAVVSHNGKKAITHFEIIERYKGYTYLKLNLETGRTHQIRVHMSHIGYPIVGDYIYGRKRNEFKIEGQLLHAKTVGFNHPKNNEYMEFTENEPEDFSTILDTLNRRNK